MRASFVVLALSALLAAASAASLSDELDEISKLIKTIERLENKDNNAKIQEKDVAAKPNVLFIVADDLGWNDVGYVNDEVQSPVIDSLAQSGVILDNNYVQAVCTPSRHTIMTGRYPYRSMMQHMVLSEDTPHCSPTNLKFLPERFKDQGYETYAVGKWHLGFCKWECTPTYRGFDHFYGCYAGAQGYYTHKAEDGYDWRNDKDTEWEAAGKYHTDIVRDYAVNAIKTQNSADPFFMYLSFTNVHTPLEVPQKYIDMFPDSMDEGRRVYLAMMYVMDEAIGQIVQALKDTGLYDNTLITFTSDNGGEQGGNSDNAPLRGGKGSLWEGGNRVRGWVHGPMLKKSGYVHEGLFHGADWTPTLMSIIGGEQPEAGTIDGKDQSDMIINGGPSVRDHIIYNIDMQPGSTFGQAAIRVDDFKLIWGNEGFIDGWGREDMTFFYESPANLALLGMTPKEARETARSHATARADSAAANARSYISFTQQDIQIMQQLFAVKTFNSQNISSGSMHLFNIKDDPFEKDDLAEKPEYASKVEMFKNYIVKLIDDYVAPPAVQSAHWTDQSNPELFDDTWSPGWCDELDILVPDNLMVKTTSDPDF